MIVLNNQAFNPEPAIYKKRDKMNRIIRLIVSILVCQLAGVAGSFFTAPSIQTWYSGLNKPAFAPPNWLFAPVWVSLFFLMGVSLFLVWEKGFKGIESRLAIYAFSIQLALNAAWSFLFFGLQNPFLAFVEILLLWAAILVTIILFYVISKKAAILLVPYIVWVTIASILNYSIWFLNL
jgi:tryptophan-rich sensory protein